MQDFNVVSEQRKELYWWLASLFSEPLDSEDIAEYQGDDVRGFLKGLQSLPALTSAVEDFQTALDKTFQREQPQRILSDSFTNLFHNPQTQVASLRASAYPDNTLENPDLEKSLSDWFARYPKATQDLADLPPDHISVQLYLMGWLANMAASATEMLAKETLLNEQRELINEYMLQWLKTFNTQLQQHDKLGFYSAVSGLMMCILKMDKDYLDGAS